MVSLNHRSRQASTAEDVRPDIRIIREEDGLAVRDIGLAPAPSKTPPAYAYAADLFHVGTSVGGKIVSVGSFILEDFPQDESAAYLATSGHWRLRGMATLPEFRGMGYASSILDFGLAEIVRRKGRLLWFNGRTTAAAFYTARGFRKMGSERIVSGLQPHFRFLKLLDGTSSTEEDL